MIDADQRAGKTHFARNNCAQLSFYDLVDAQHAVFHGSFSWAFVGRLCGTSAFDTNALQFLRDCFKLIALDHVAYLIFAEVAELNSTFQSRAHFFHIILKAT